MKPTDRKISLHDARTRAYKIIEDLGLHYTTHEREIGPYRRSDCVIHKQNHGAVASGSGNLAAEVINETHRRAVLPIGVPAARVPSMRAAAA